MKFTTSEKSALIAFLKTLTDRTFLADPRFSNPFVDRKDAAKSVKRTVLTAGAVVLAVGAAAARAPVDLRSAVLNTEMPPTPLAPRARVPDAMIEPLASFDGNADYRISRVELPERMQGLVARGDRNADAALDSDEIRALVNAADSERVRVAVRGHSSEGLPGVIKDLKLTPAKYAGALAVISGQTLSRNINNPTGNHLYTGMRALLDDEEYENFVAAAARLSRSRSPQVIK